MRRCTVPSLQPLQGDFGHASCTPGSPTTECHGRRTMGLSYGRRHAMHHAWRHPSSAMSCRSCLLIPTIKSPMITLRVMLGHKLRQPRTNTQVLEARLGNLPRSNSVPIHGVTEVRANVCRHQTRGSHETLAREGFSDTVVTERHPDWMEQG